MLKSKMTLGDIVEAGIEYCAFQRIRNLDGVSGYRYILDKPLTKSQKEFVSKFKNTIVSSCGYRYAPEIRHETLTLFDKCIST